jgi:hypothetical protein
MHWLTSTFDFEEIAKILVLIDRERACLREAQLDACPAQCLDFFCRKTDGPLSLLE